MKTWTWCAIVLAVGAAAVVTYRMTTDETPCITGDAAYCKGAALRRAILGNPSIDYQACIDEYATAARTELGSRAVMAACNRLSNATSPAATKWARCVIDTVPSAGNDLGVRLALRACNR